MFGGKSEAEALNAVALLKATEKAGERASRKAAKLLAREQGSFIERGVKPDGGAQQKNTVAWRKRKKGKPPLENTGRLKDPKNWRVRNNKADFTITLRPPRDREAAIAINRTRGYRTILDQGLQPEFVKRVGEILAKEMERVSKEAPPKEQ